MTAVKFQNLAVATSLLFFSTLVQANEINFFFCKKGLKSASDEVYVVDYQQRYIYQVEYRPPVDRVAVTRFRLLEIIGQNIRGVIDKEYSGDYLAAGGDFKPLPANRIRKMISLDVRKGVLMKLYTGAGDKFGACEISSIDLANISSVLKESGLKIKNNVLNKKG